MFTTCIVYIQVLVINNGDLQIAFTSSWAESGWVWIFSSFIWFTTVVSRRWKPESYQCGFVAMDLYLEVHVKFNIKKQCLDFFVH